MRIDTIDAEEYHQIPREGSRGSAHTSVTGAGSLARRAAFLAQRVFTSDLIYVEPVFFGFNLITNAHPTHPKVITPNAQSTTNSRGTRNQVHTIQVSSKAQSNRGEKDAPERDIKRGEPESGLVLFRVGNASGHPSRTRFRFCRS